MRLGAGTAVPCPYNGEMRPSAWAKWLRTLRRKAAEPASESGRYINQDQRQPSSKTNAWDGRSVLRGYREACRLGSAAVLVG